MKPAYDEAKKGAEPLVGGCEEACGDHKGALLNFLLALYGAADADAPQFRRFIDFTTLVDNGEKLGAVWAQMFLDGKLEERGVQVGEWIAKYVNRVGRGAGREALEASVSSAAFRRIAAREVEYTLVRPDVAGSGTGSTWVVRMNLRALEWLVSEIQDAP